MEVDVFQLVPFFICSRGSTEVDFRNSVEIGIFSELLFSSVEFDKIPCAKLRGILGEKLQGISKEILELL